MSERYIRVFSLKSEIYAASSPIIISAGALLKDNQTGNIIAQLKFTNISEKTIVAIKVSIKAFDVTGKEVRGVDEFQYLDLSAKLYDEFGQKQPIIMPDVTTRSFSVECTTVVFEDGSLWELKPCNEYKPLPEPMPLAELLGSDDLVEQYKIETTLKSFYVPTEYEDIWVCSCGCVNSSAIDNCRRCRVDKEQIFALLDKERLENDMEMRHKALERYIEERTERVRLEAEAKAKRVENIKQKLRAALHTIKKTVMIGLPCVLLIIAFFAWALPAIKSANLTAKLDSAMGILENSARYSEAEVLDALSTAVETGLEKRWKYADNQPDGVRNYDYEKIIAAEEHILNIDDLNISSERIKDAIDIYKDGVKEDIQLLSNEYVEYDKLRYPAYSRALAIVTLAEEGVIDLPDKYYRVYSALAIEAKIMVFLSEKSTLNLTKDETGLYGLTIDINNNSPYDYTDFKLKTFWNDQMDETTNKLWVDGTIWHARAHIPTNVNRRDCEVSAKVSFREENTEISQLYWY